MRLVWGIFYSVLAAFTNTAIDSTRKWAASGPHGLPSEGLVTVPALIDAVLAVSGVWASGKLQGARLRNAPVFVTATVSSSLLLLVSRYMYQRAIFLSPLSLTIPYLAFTPAILIATAYVLLGEVPSPSGLVGVMVVALGGYLLNRVGTSSTATAALAVGGGGRELYGGKEAGGGGGAAAGANGHGANGWHGKGEAQVVALPGGATGVLLQRSAAASAWAADVEAPAPGALHALPGAGGGLPVAAGVCAVGGVAAGAAGGGLPGGGGGGGACGTPSKRHSMRSLLALGKRSSSMGDLLQQQLVVFRWHQEPGTVLMIAVAIIWSLTASLDKLGVITGPSIWAYFAAQRLAIGAASLAYILLRQPRLLLLLRSHFPLLLAISCLELAAVVLFLLAVQNLLVSYVVAIKRCNVLFSVGLGALLFRESVLSRLPYIALMMGGMMLIVLEPTGFVHTHN